MAPHGVWTRLATAGALLLAAASPAAGRPLTPEDLLRVEGIGQAVVTPGGRWLLLERRAPVRDGWRFDHDRYNLLFRTTLQLVDLRRPGPPRDLAPREPGAGYLLGPVSPDGARAAVFRLREDRFELGVATLADRQVRWTGLTPDLAEYGRAVQWRSPGELALLQVADGRPPFLIRWVTPVLQLPDRWRAWARGEGSHTVSGSGRFADLRPHDPALRLTVLEVATGRTRILAEGEFRDLELSPGGRWAALMEAGPDIPMVADQAIHQETNLIKTRLRLRWIDLETGAEGAAPRDLDLGSQLLAWSPEGGRLLLHARRDGQPWRESRLLQLGTLTGKLSDLSGVVRPEVFNRPETAAAGWLGPDPIVYGRTPDSHRADWWRLSPAGPINLTRHLAAFSVRGAVVSAAGLALTTPQGAVALDAEGGLRETLQGPLRGPVQPTVGWPSRLGAYLSEQGAVAGLAGDGGAPRLHRLNPDGRVQTRPVPKGAELIVSAPAGALVRVTQGGGADTYSWVGEGRRPARLFSLNAHLAEIDRPAVHPIRHPGPQGPLTSWLLVPARSPDASPPPLVVWPYPGRTYATPPGFLDPRNSPSVDLPGLLAGHGYAVLLPSLPIPPGETGAERLAERLLAIVQAAAESPATGGLFDDQRLAIAGDSFGGYGTLAAIGQTDRFKAAVAWASMPNLLAKWGDFGYPTRVSTERGLPNPQWVEGVQAQMLGPPWARRERYLAASPLLHLGQTSTPLLIGHGELDNYGLGAAEQAFSAYLRRDADAQLVTYWGEGHRLSSPGNYVDFHHRVFAWLDQHLAPPPAR